MVSPPWAPPPFEYHICGAGDTPDINCDNAACGKPFHRRCLVEWLNSGGCLAHEPADEASGTLVAAVVLLRSPREEIKKDV